MSSGSLFSKFLAALAGGALSYGLYREKQRLLEKRQRISQREDISLESVYDEFYKNDNIDFQDFQYLWQEIASLLCLDPGRLRPSDRFDTELSPVKGKEMCDEQEDLYDYFEALSESRKIEFNPRSYNTVDDLVKAFVKKK